MSAHLATVNERASPRVLIVDDAAGMRAYLSVIMTNAGFHCIEACDGAEAFEIVLAGGINLVLTDLDMPRMDGFGLISAIGLLKPCSRPPIIVISGLLDQTLAERRPELRTVGALLAKPAPPGELLNVVARVMGARACG